MGYVGATVKLEDVRKKMAKSRTEMKQSYSAPSLQKFCRDNEAFNILCRLYRYQYEMWNGNVEGIHSDTYAVYYAMITDTSNYRYAVKSLKEDGTDNKETVYLLDGLRMLRQRYK